jgi:hypothetical protein
MLQQSTIEKRKPVRFAYISRFAAIFLVEKRMLHEKGRIMAKGLIAIGRWDIVDETNVAAVKADRTIEEFIISKVPPNGLHDQCNTPDEDLYEPRSFKQTSFRKDPAKSGGR